MLYPLGGEGGIMENLNKNPRPGFKEKLITKN
jgi:hypothetical protein